MGEAKNTYGTGCFMLLNTGPDIVRSRHGLLTTLCYQFGDDKPVYALEGSVAVTGALVQWLRDRMRLINTAAEIEDLARLVPDNGGMYFVPAFSGLFAPHWRSEARGLIIGMTSFVNRGHFARAALEAAAFQTREIVDAMAADSGIRLKVLKVDGGMTANDLLMQIQADVLGVPVVRPKVSESTALGAAYAAGLAVGYWRSLDDLRRNWGVDKTWKPSPRRQLAHQKLQDVEKSREPHVRLARGLASRAHYANRYGESSRRWRVPTRRGHWVKLRLGVIEHAINALRLAMRQIKALAFSIRRVSRYDFELVHPGGFFRRTIGLRRPLANKTDVFRQSAQRRALLSELPSSRAPIKTHRYPHA